jgi:hypothetical protein
MTAGAVSKKSKLVSLVVDNKVAAKEPEGP